jgi:hypothetical protein
LRAAAGRALHSAAMSQGALDALRRLMGEAASGGAAKVDAVTALAQRTLFVPTWRIGDDGFRTVVNSSGIAAMPVWLDLAGIEEASRMFGWAMPDGRVPYKEIGARAALGHALAHNLLVVVELGGDPSMEIEQDELRPLLAARATPVPPARMATPIAAPAGFVPPAAEARMTQPTPAAQAASPRVTPTPPARMPSPIAAPAGYVPGTPARKPQRFDESSAPFAAPPELPRSSLADPQRAQEAPQTRVSQAQPSRVAAPDTSRASQVARGSSVPGGAVQATFGSGPGAVTIGPLQSEAGDTLLRALADALREFPEVEWALLASVARGPAAAVPTVAVRVDPSFRTRVGDIVAAVRAAASSEGAGLDVLLLDDAKLMKQARAAGQPFYPWRR